MTKQYRYFPAGWDLIDPRPHHPKAGTLVILTPKNDPCIAGCPPQGTIDHVFISDAATGRFIGLVAKRSLRAEPQPIKES